MNTEPRSTCDFTKTVVAFMSPKPTPPTPEPPPPLKAAPQTLADRELANLLDAVDGRKARAQQRANDPDLVVLRKTDPARWAQLEAEMEETESEIAEQQRQYGKSVVARLKKEAELEEIIARRSPPTFEDDWVRQSLIYMVKGREQHEMDPRRALHAVTVARRQREAGILSAAAVSKIEQAAKQALEDRANQSTKAGFDLQRNLHDPEWVASELTSPLMID